jgi:CHASE1-domain containing sensor protein
VGRGYSRRLGRRGRGDEAVRDFSQRARRIEAANLKHRSASPRHQDFPTLPLDGSDLIERNGDPPRAAAGQESVEARDLELAHMSWAVALSPPDGIATSSHGERVSALGLRCNRS